jgi:hypothetical protein
MKIFLSPTKMDTYRQCPQCFYDEIMLEIKRPRALYPTLPNGIDQCLKDYCDKFRGSLPPELAHLAGYRLMDDQSLVNTFRQWNGLKIVKNVSVKRPTMAHPNARVNHTIIFNSGIDDLLWNPSDEVTVMDFKTKKDEPPEDYGDRYYQNNMDSYAYILKQNGYKVSKEAYLWYWWPEEVDEQGKWVFGQKTLTMKVDPDRMGVELEKMAELLPGIGREKGEYRKNFPPNPECTHCGYVEEKRANEQADEVVES